MRSIRSAVPGILGNMNSYHAIEPQALSYGTTSAFMLARTVQVKSLEVAQCPTGMDVNIRAVCRAGTGLSSGNNRVAFSIDGAPLLQLPEA